MADENKLRSLKDLHSAIAGLAAHYIPKHEMADYFKPEELEGVQTKPSYNVTENQRGVIETILVGLLEKKTKTVQKKGKDKEVTANGTESLVMAAKEDIPALLRNDEDNYQNLVHLHPSKMRRFVAGMKDVVLNYLETNQKKLQKYGIDEAIAAVSKLDRGLENRVIDACKKEIRHLESAFRAEARDAGKAWRQVGTLERKSGRLEKRADRLKTKKEELEGAVANLEAAQADLTTRYEADLKELNAATAKVASLEQASAALKKELADVRKDYDADLKKFAEANNKLNQFEDQNAQLQKDLENTYAQLADNDTEIENLCEGIARVEREKDEAVKDTKKKALKYLGERVKKVTEHFQKEIQAKKERIGSLEGDLDKVEGQYEQEKTARETYEAAFTVLNARYQARFAELGSMVAEWYAFTEKAMQSKELSGNEQLKELRSRNKKLAVLVTDLIEEAKSGKRVGQGKKDIPAPWHEQAPLSTLEDADNKYKQMLDKAEAEHRREVWGWMHALDTDKAPYELKQGVYKRFLATGPKDNAIKGVAHCNLGTILAEQRKDYKAAKMQYELAVRSAEAELAEKPKDKAAEGRLHRYKANLALCQEKLVA